MTENPTPPAADVIDIKTRSKLLSIPCDADTKPGQFLNTWKKFCKDTGVKTVLIVTVDEHDYVTWGFVSGSDHHTALSALTLEDLREELKDNLFGEFELEEE